MYSSFCWWCWALQDVYKRQPQEVFDHPANLFVAGFIGTPQMNLFDAHLARKDGKYTVTVGSVTVELSEEKQQRLAAKDVARCV